MRLAISTTETLTDLKTDLVVANNNNNLKSQLASVTVCRNTGVYNVRNGAVIELLVVASINGFPRHWWVEVDC